MACHHKTKIQNDALMVLVFLSCMCLFCKIVSADEWGDDDPFCDRRWGYDDGALDKFGPSRWHMNTSWSSCNHRFQSPIDIADSNVIYGDIPPLTMHTRDGTGVIMVNIKNMGEYVYMKCPARTVNMTGGNLPGTFIVANVHFHWPSEHMYRGLRYPLEMHVVSFNNKYRNFQEAAGKADGVHVTAILFNEERRLGYRYRSSRGMQDFMAELPKIREPGLEVSLNTYNISLIMPDADQPFFRYTGSLTNPPCTDNVIWSVFVGAKSIPRSQLREFKRVSLNVDLHPTFDGNVRPVQPRNDRPIYYSQASSFSVRVQGLSRG